MNTLSGYFIFLEYFGISIYKCIILHTSCICSEEFFFF